MLRQGVDEKIRCYSIDERNYVLGAIQADTWDGQRWLDKLRRFVSLHGRNLKKQAQRVFLEQVDSHLYWMFKCLCAGLTQHPNDQAIINAILFLQTCADFDEGSSIEDQVKELQQCLINSSPLPVSKGTGIPLFTGLSESDCQGLSSKRIVILSPSPYSLYTLAVYSILARLKVDVAAVVVRRFTVSRFRDEFSRDGQKLLRKIWRKLILRGNEAREKCEVSPKYVVDKLCVRKRDIRRLARSDGIRVIEVEDFKAWNGDVASLDSRIAIFTGGGMLSDKFLGCFRHGVINTHMGSLPQFKGMDVVEAPILEGAFDDIALTCHFMVPQLDAGPLLQEFKLSSSHYATLGALRNELSAVMPFIAVDSCLGYLMGSLKEIEQPCCGRQYYSIHSRLHEVVRNVLRERFVKGEYSLPRQICDDSLGSLPE